MKYWFDFEFEENGETIKPISVGFICEDGREYYAEFAEYNRASAPAWLSENVIPLLGGPIKPTAVIALDLVDFLGASPEIWGWFGSYDWVVLCQLYGTMMQLPASWPMFQRESMNYVPYGWRQPRRVTAEHHALYDAIWQKQAWEKLRADGLL